MKTILIDIGTIIYRQTSRKFLVKKNMLYHSHATLSRKKKLRYLKGKTTFFKSIVCCYLIFGLGLIFIDSRAATAWFVNGFFFGAANWLAIYKLRSLPLSILFALFFIGHGVGAPIFFLRENEYDSTGWNAIGDFDFTLSSFYQAYLPVFAFCGMLLFAGWIGQRYYLKGHFRFRFQSYFNDFKSFSGNKDGVLILIIIAMLGLNYWMYINSIGVSGIPPKRLPFKLVGALYYFRLCIFPLVLMYLLPSCRHKLICSVLVFGFAVFTSFVSGGRTAIFIYSIPAIIILYLNGKVRYVYFLALATLLIYPITSVVKNLNYAGTLNLIAVVGEAFDNPIELMDLLKVPLALMDRLYGPQQVILSGYAPYNDPIDSLMLFLSGKPPVQDAALIQGLVFSSDQAFGVSFGLPGAAIMASNGNPLFTIPIVIAITFFFSVINKLLSENTNYSIQLTILYGVFLSVYFLNDGFWGIFVGLTIFLVVIKTLSKYMIKLRMFPSIECVRKT